MAAADRDELTVPLAGLPTRFDGLRPFHVRRAGAQRYDTAGHARSTVDAPVRIRTLDTYVDVPVVDAFDLVAGVPTITPLPPDER